MKHLELPSRLQGVFFDFVWDRAKVWDLPTPATHVSWDEVEWHLDLTVWSTTPGEPLFDLAPRAVLEAPDDFPWHWERTLRVDPIYPLEMFMNGHRWVILDGYHRLAHLALRSVESVMVRLHPSEFRSRIVLSRP